MILINDFIQTNLDQRLIDPLVNFNVNLELKQCKHLPFHQAVDYTVEKIANQFDKIYLSFSGGADSEYMVRAFHRNKIDFNVIIVNSRMNVCELEDAFLTCKELAIKPIILNVSELDFFNMYYNEIYKKLNGTGVFSAAQLFCVKYAIERNGILLTGDHHMDDTKNPYGVGMIEMAEFEFYPHILYPNSTINFYGHTLELLRAIAFFDIPNFDKFKCRHVYQIKERPKTSYKFKDATLADICIRITSRSDPDPYCYPMSKRQFLEAT